MRTLALTLVPWTAAHEGPFTSENLIIATNFLVVFASMFLAWATVHAAAKERKQERKFTLNIIRLLTRSNSNAAHRKDS